MRISFIWPWATSACRGHETRWAVEEQGINEGPDDLGNQHYCVNDARLQRRDQWSYHLRWSQEPQSMLRF